MSELEMLKGTDVGEFGVVYKENVVLRDSPDNSSAVVGRLPFNKRVYIQKQLPYEWYFIVTEDNLPGFVPAGVIKKNPPEPFAVLHKVKEGESAIGIAERYYRANSQTWGTDLRFYINVLVYANDGDGNPAKGIFRRFGNDWRDVKTHKDYFIWIPSVEFAEKLKGVVESGSISFGVWNISKKAMTKLWDFIKFGSSFVAGLIHGFLESLWEIFVGVWDLVNMFWSIIKSIFTLNIVSDAKSIFENLLNLNFTEILENWIRDFEVKWNHEDVLKRGHFRGWVTGYAIAEILINFFSLGGVLAVKFGGKMGKISKVLKELGAIKDFVTNSSKVIEQLTPLLKRTPLYGKARKALLLENDALSIVDAVEKRYGSYILKSLRLESAEGKLSILRALVNPTYENIEGFFRKSQHLVSEIGKSKTGKILGWSTEEIADKGFKGKMFEALVNRFGKDSIEDLNKINKNFPVVDVISKEKRYIISIARGTPDYLWDKIQVLFNVEITASGHLPAKLNKHIKMIDILKKNKKIVDVDDFMNRARLLIPADAVMPLKAMIISRVKNMHLQNQMINAIINEI